MGGKNIYDYMERSGTDDITNVISNTLYGFSHSGELPLLTSNKDLNGTTFFTRPLLNLTDKNLRNVNTMIKYLTNEPNSIARFARCTLDPRLAYGIDHDLYKQKALQSLVDPLQAFIPVLSSTLKTLSGWPSIAVPTYTSKPGLRKEQWSMVDGIYEINDTFDLQASFMNFKGEPITTMLGLWLRYPPLVFENSLTQYIDVMLDFAKDYETRIYRFITDESGRFIKKSAMTGASYPNSEDTGKSFDFNRERKYNDEMKDITTKFVSQIAIYNDDRTLLDFNRIVATFNPEVKKYLTERPNTMEVIPPELLQYFNNRGYPIIDLDTYELKWLIDSRSKSYKKIVDILIDNGDSNRYKKVIKKDVTEIELQEMKKLGNNKIIV